MNFGVLLVLAAGAFIAYVNGSNDVSKGIATLVGSGVSDYRRAILWGTLWTGAGCFAGGLFAAAMLDTFGKGLLARGVSPTWDAALATILGAAVFVGIATRTGLPVSTTHAIVGSLAGVGTIAYGLGGINWDTIGTKIAIPLLASPVIALLITLVALWMWKTFRRRSLREAATDCLCVEVEPGTPTPAETPEGAVLSVGVTAPHLHVLTGTEETCAARSSSGLRLTVNHLHWLTSGGTSFARGMNDAPKMVALILAAGALAGDSVRLKPLSFAIVAFGIMAGSWVGGRRVTSLLAEKVTKMDHREGFMANLITSALVGPGAALGLPMSTTQVSAGAIMGIGTQNQGGMNWKVVWNILLAWIITLPAAAALGVLIYGGLRLVN